MYDVEGVALIAPTSYLLSNLKDGQFNADTGNGFGWMENLMPYVGATNVISPQEGVKELIGPIEKACP